ncbi:hypothetical protein ZWY2020_034264 [Hordeum vulgare]|nr:hypothetical protein ZWY2020_034264 [Hordeum vulgare]
MTKRRRRKYYIDNSLWEPEADSVESGYRVPFGNINVFIGMIGTPVPEPDISSDIVEPARYVLPVTRRNKSLHVFVSFMQGDDAQDEVAGEEITPVNSDGESSIGETESIHPLKEGQLGGVSLAMDPQVFERSRRQIAIYMAGSAKPQQSPNGNNETGGTSKPPAQTMAELVAEIANLMATTITSENQESVNDELTKMREAMAKAQRDMEPEAARIETQSSRPRLSGEVKAASRASDRNNPARLGHTRSRSGVFLTKDHRAAHRPMLANTKFITSRTTHRECSNNPPQGDPQRQEDRGGFQNNPKQLNSGQYHVFTTNTYKRDLKVKHRTFVGEPALPRYLHWSEQSITWSREDHPPRVDNPGDLTLVVAPQVAGYNLSKVLMDGGSNINILYFDTFRWMNLLEKDLTPSSTVFHDIVPGKSAYLIGRIKLNVAFGTSSNYRSESLLFQVVKVKSPYHALFGRLAYAKFMARPCYVYLKLKMPGPKGPITVHDNRKIPRECEEGDTAYAESACAAEELKFH